jgi:hypothetical protein
LPKYQEYRIKRTALQVYNVLGCRDYGRIDFRLSSDGVPYVLEMNPNPGISPYLGTGDQPDFMPFASQKAGLSYDDLIMKIFNEALERNNMTIRILPSPKPMEATIKAEVVVSNPDVSNSISLENSYDDSRKNNNK